MFLMLIDPDYMAYRYKKHRGWIYIAGGALFILLAKVISLLPELVFAFSRQTADTSAFLWPIFGFAGVGLFAVLLGCWYLVRDEMYGDYERARNRHRGNQW